MKNPDYRDCLERIREANKEVRRLHRDVERGYAVTDSQIEEAKIARSEILAERDEMELVAATEAAEFALGKPGPVPSSWKIQKSALVRGRQTYVAKENMPMEIVGRQAEKTIRGICSETLDRESIAVVLRNSLSRKSGIGIVRIDVRKYFDSISHTVLEKQIGADSRVDQITRRTVQTFLRSFDRVGPGKRRGVPTGLPLGNCLADFYLSNLDRELVRTEGVIFYARYVDDIIIVTFKTEQTKELYSEVVARLKKLNLEINGNKSGWWVTQEGKTVESSATTLAKEGDEFRIDYLGYCYKGGRSIDVDMTDARKKKMESRIEKAYSTWAKSLNARKGSNRRMSADGLLVKRMEVLCGNYRLWGVKSNAKAGIYFSNSVLNPDAESLVQLDAKHESLLAQHKPKMSLKLQNTLSGLSFVEGFRKRTYVNVARGSSRMIFSIWR